MVSAWSRSDEPDAAANLTAEQWMGLLHLALWALGRVVGLSAPVLHLVPFVLRMCCCRAGDA